MSLEHGILGFLSMQPMSGYDIKKLFDMSASYFWPADQAQIYRTLKKLAKEELIELKACTKGTTVDKKVYAITDKGQDAYLHSASQNTVSDFISRDLFLMQLFFSGSLDRVEQLKLLDKQLNNIQTLEKQLLNNYSSNYRSFVGLTGLTEDDRRMQSAIYAHRWGLIKCREYAKLLEEMKAELEEKR